MCPNPGESDAAASDNKHTQPKASVPKGIARQERIWVQPGWKNPGTSLRGTPKILESDKIKIWSIIDKPQELALRRTCIFAPRTQAFNQKALPILACNEKIIPPQRIKGWPV